MRERLENLNVTPSDWVFSVTKVYSLLHYVEKRVLATLTVVQLVNKFPTHHEVRRSWPRSQESITLAFFGKNHFNMNYCRHTHTHTHTHTRAHTHARAHAHTHTQCSSDAEVTTERPAGWHAIRGKNGISRNIWRTNVRPHGEIIIKLITFIGRLIHVIV